MDTSRLKNFAPAVRRQLIEAVTRKLDYVLSAQTPDYLTTYATQVAALRKLNQENRSALIERVAYTWFNRLAALRFLDAREWHPFQARVLTPATSEETLPQLLKKARSGALPQELQRHTAPRRLQDLLDGSIPSPDAQGEVYRHLVLAACRFYHALLPNLFEKLDDETELLLPDDLLTEHSVVHGFRTQISDEDCGDGQRANVEILGWLYQFYISERKEQVMARKSAVPTEDIPAVTQLFTPHWIVRYLVENSLGRLWLLNRPGSRLREHMRYYIEGEPETDFLKITKPEEIRLCDPAVGSGHMLTYAFDLLFAIYEEEGYAPTEIPGLILRHNLTGLEICPRAAQLAELALVFKAREKSRRFFQPENLIRPNIIELREVFFEENELRDYIRPLNLGDLFNQPVLRLLHQFKEAKNFGSLIQPSLEERTIADIRCGIEAKDLGGQLFLRETHLKVLRVLEQAEALTQRYHVVVANPPYMGKGAFNATLRKFADTNYANSRADLFSMFIDGCRRLSLPKGFVGMITMHGWMFIATFEAFRRSILAEASIDSMLHLGARAFDSISGEIVKATAFVLLNRPKAGRGLFLRLTVERSELAKRDAFLNANTATLEKFFRREESSFSAIPSSPLAYWVSPKTRELFQTLPSLGDLAEPRQGLATTDNGRFVRFWHEVPFSGIGFGFPDGASAAKSGLRWFPFNKGGSFRKWFGNDDVVVNWQNDGHEIRKNIVTKYPYLNGNPDFVAKNAGCYFREGTTWSKITSGDFSVRKTLCGYVFSDAGMKIFHDSLTTLDEITGLLNSRLTPLFLGSLSETLNFEQGNIARIPYKPVPLAVEDVRKCVALARADWDNFETSWDFRDHPLLRSGLRSMTLEASWRNWEAQSTAAIRQMQELETENNRLFITAYGLEGELQPEVPEEQITLARADARQDMATFLSYAVGCMMGRYSLDHPGLILANAGDTLESYLSTVGKSQDQLSFTPDEDGIIPVLDGEWFDDDIVARTRDFLRATFGEATLKENLSYIERALGKDGKSKSLRDYFTGDFYKDHLQTYKKRPIYWMVQSPKKGFQCLIYLHRYNRDTMNQVLNRYLRDYEVKLKSRIAYLEQAQITANTAKDRTSHRKEAEKLTKILHECQEWERSTLLPLAQARIDLDLDDGVKVNYLKLAEALAPITGLSATEED